MRHVDLHPERRLRGRRILAAVAIAIIAGIIAADTTEGRTAAMILGTIAGIVAIYIVRNWETIRQPTSLRAIYAALQHRCASLRMSPRFQHVPRDLLHNFIVPMANNLDTRSVRNPHEYSRYHFQDASVHCTSATPFHPSGIRVLAPQLIPVPNPIDQTYLNLQNKGNLDGSCHYYGGSVFRSGLALYHRCADKMVRLPIDNIRKIIMMRRLLVIQQLDPISPITFSSHSATYTFLSTINLGAVEVSEEQLPRDEREYLTATFK